MCRISTKWLKNKIHELEKNEIIRPSISPYSAPVILVPKKNGDLRLVVDYRALNEQVASDKFPLPRIDKILDSISSKNKIFYFFRSYPKLPPSENAEKDVYKTAFSTTECGSYEYLRVPLDLRQVQARYVDPYYIY